MTKPFTAWIKCIDEKELPAMMQRVPFSHQFFQQRDFLRVFFAAGVHARRSGANPPLAAGFETRSTARKATFPEAGRRCHRRKSPRPFGHPLCFRLPAGKQKIFRHEQHKPPNARFGSFAIHAEDFASVIIFRLIRQTRANGRIACLRVYCTIPRRVCQRVFARADT